MPAGMSGKFKTFFKRIKPKKVKGESTSSSSSSTSIGGNETSISGGSVTLPVNPNQTRPPIPIPSPAAVDRPSVTSENDVFLTPSRSEFVSATSVDLLSYYHPEIKTMEQLKRFLSRFTGRDGHFILRNSFNEVECYTLSVIHWSGLKHIRIERHGNNRISIQGKDFYFTSIGQLVDHYKNEIIPNTDGIDVRLATPIRRTQGQASPIDPDYLTITPPSRDCHPPPTENDRSHCYTTLREPVRMLDRVIGMLEAEDEGRREICDCGLPFAVSELARGWSVHLSNDADTRGKVYYMSPDNISHWELPRHVMLELTPDQQDVVKNLYMDSDLGCGGGGGCDVETRSFEFGRIREDGMKPPSAPGPWIENEDYQSLKKDREEMVPSSTASESGAKEISASSPASESGEKEISASSPASESGAKEISASSPACSSDVVETSPVSESNENETSASSPASVSNGKETTPALKN